MLEVSLEDLIIFVQQHGIPNSVLVENSWSGHENFVIQHEGSLWRLGYAERGNASLISTHNSITEARSAVTRELWSLYETAANPSYWKDGVANGTPMV